MFEVMDSIQPDLILLDVEMPEMSGFEVLQILKENSVTSAIPVIFLTGSTDAEDEVRGLQMGVVDFVRKPFSASVLQNRIKNHLEMDEIVKERTADLQSLKSALVLHLRIWLKAVI